MAYEKRGIMEHYFSNTPKVLSKPKLINFNIFGKNFKFHSDNGVFSKNKIDIGTSILLKTILNDILVKEDKINILDIGCGYGIVGIVMKKFFKNSYITFSDINKRALDLSKKNIKENKIENDYELIESDLYTNIENKYNIIISNPPIRAGKKIVFDIYKGAYEKLLNNGLFYCVIMTKHGAKSTLKELETIFNEVSCINLEAGYRIYRAKK